MLFHVTISHSKEDCPGQRPDDPLALVTPSEHLEALGQKLAVNSHDVLWGAACILWAEPEHLAFALLDAPNADAALRYVRELTPAAWLVRALPVFRLPDQLPLVRHVLTTAAVAVQQPVAPAPLAAVEDEHEEPPPLAPHAAAPVQVASPVAAPVGAEPRDEGAERPTLPKSRTERPTVPALPGIEPSTPAAARASEAVTRIVERPVLVPREPDEHRAPTPTPPARSSASLTDLLESIDTSNKNPEGPAGGSHTAKQPSPTGEIPTLILPPPVGGQQHLRLLAVAGPAKNAVFEVGTEGATIGRLPENKIHLSDGRLSRTHARLEFQEGAYWIRDLGSANGTLVNGETLSGAHRLEPGDSIEVGTSLLTVMDDQKSST